MQESQGLLALVVPVGSMMADHLEVVCFILIGHLILELLLLAIPLKVVNERG